MKKTSEMTKADWLAEQKRIIREEARDEKKDTLRE